MDTKECIIDIYKDLYKIADTGCKAIGKQIRINRKQRTSLFLMSLYLVGVGMVLFEQNKELLQLKKDMAELKGEDKNI